MKKSIVILISFFTVFLMISTSTAASNIKCNKIKLENHKDEAAFKNFEKDKTQLLIDSFQNKLKSIAPTGLIEFWFAWIINYAILYVDYMENSILFKIFHPVGNFLVNILGSDFGFGIVFLYPESLVFFIKAFFVTLNE